MIKDLWNAMRLYIEDRLSSPLLTGFAFAWSIINYRFFLILFSNERFTEKIALIENYVFQSNEVRLYKGLIYPLLAAFTYVLIYPFLDRLIYAAWRWHQHKLIQIRQRIDEERPLSEKDRTQLLSRIYEAERAQEDAMQRLETTIESQRVRIKELEEQALAIAKNDTLPEDQPPHEQQEGNPNGFLDLPLSLEALTSYVNDRFPNLPVGEDILRLLLRDIDKRRYPKLSDINNVVENAASAVETYKKEKPEWFTKGADYLTKSLGFLDKKFRSRHPFADETQRAFIKYDESSSTNLADVEHTKFEDFSSLEVRILEAIAKAEREDRTATHQLMIESIRGDRVELKYHLDDLSRRKYLESHYANGDWYYELTHDGRRVLIALGKTGKNSNKNSP